MPARPELPPRRIGAASHLSLILGLVLGCGEPPAAAPESLTADNISYARDVQPLFAASCSAGRCHGGLSNKRIDLSADASYATLIRGRSRLDPNLRLVVPGEPGTSLLWLKLTGKPPVGKPMPPKGKPLEPEALAVIEAWILSGAPNN